MSESWARSVIFCLMMEKKILKRIRVNVCAVNMNMSAMVSLYNCMLMSDFMLIWSVNCPKKKLTFLSFSW